MLTVIIPSKTEKFLDNTIRDVLKNATGEIEVIPVLDGYDCPRIEDPRVNYLILPPTTYSKKRHGINQAVQMAKGEYVMSLDAHCMVAKGFDEQLIKDHQPNWVQIPRRNRLDAETWTLQDQCGRPPIDYEYLMWRSVLMKEGFHGYKWDAKTLAKQDVMIDDTLTFQGSCWFMTKDWFQKMGFMQVEGYTGWGQEAEEISFTTWKNGGRVVTNKNTWFAHLHKGKKYGRMYKANEADNKKCYAFAYNYWVNENKDFFITLINKFMPLPNWPADWQAKLWT